MRPLICLTSSFTSSLPAVQDDGDLRFAFVSNYQEALALLHADPAYPDRHPIENQTWSLNNREHGPVCLFSLTSGFVICRKGSVLL
jgi:hypothetical protein